MKILNEKIWIKGWYQNESLKVVRKVSLKANLVCELRKELHSSKSSIKDIQKSVLSKRK